MDIRSKVITQELACALCSLPYVPAFPSMHTTPQLCNSCISRDHLRELDRVQSALRQAERENRPATLALAEWLRIVSFFQGRCALCELTPYQVLSIWIPIRGCVEGNVIPLCRVCEFHRQNSFLSSLERVRTLLAAPMSAQLVESEE